MSKNTKVVKMALGLNIGLVSNLKIREEIAAFSYLFTSTADYENLSTTVWDMTAEMQLVKARAWDYLKVFHGMFDNTNPVDDISYKKSSLEHFGIMGDETTIRDVNFLLLEKNSAFSETEVQIMEAYCDKFIMISNFNENPEELPLSSTIKTNRPIELWFYTNQSKSKIDHYTQKFASYFAGRGFEIGEIIPKKRAVPGYYTFYEKPLAEDQDSAWANAITKIFYHATK